MAATPVLLKVLNVDKGIEEPVGDVVFDPPLHVVFPSSSSSSGGATRLTHVTVTGYTKEDRVLSRSLEKTTTTMQFTKEPQETLKKLVSFGRYLADRKKAGIIKYNNAINLYILPPANKEDGSLVCISSFDAKKAAAAAPPPPPSSRSGSSSSSSSSSSTARAGTSSSSSSSSSAPSLPKDDFLASILTKMESTTHLRSVGVSGTAPTAVLDRAEAMDRYQALEKRIRVELGVFDTDPSFMELRLEPMDKDGRYVVHDVVTEFPDLVSVAIGDYDERHVVIYRKGHVPEGVEVYVNLRPTAPIKKKKDERVIDAETIQQAGGISVTKANPLGDQRDRRTIEEIQQEMKRRKLGGGGGL